MVTKSIKQQSKALRFKRSFFTAVSDATGVLQKITSQVTVAEQ